MDKLHTGAPQGEPWAKPDRQTAALFRRLVPAFAVAVAGLAFFAACEGFLFDNPGGEAQPLFSPFHWARAAFALVAGALVVRTIYSERAVAYGFDREALTPAGRSAARASMGVAAIVLIVGLIDPSLVAMTAETGARNGATQSDLLWNSAHFGAILFLILLPFVADSTPWLRRQGNISAFVPGRCVAAASAPLAIFADISWNNLPLQLATAMTMFAMACYARAAFDRGDQREFRLFAANVTAIALGQALLLLSELLQMGSGGLAAYANLFAVIGLACYAADVYSRRSTSRAD